MASAAARHGSCITAAPAWRLHDLRFPAWQPHGIRTPAAQQPHRICTQPHSIRTASAHKNTRPRIRADACFPLLGPPPPVGADSISARGVCAAARSGGVRHPALRPPGWPRLSRLTQSIKIFRRGGIHPARGRSHRRKPGRYRIGPYRGCNATRFTISRSAAPLPGCSRLTPPFCPTR